MGQDLDSGLRFFGQAIDGDMDLGEDGLPDIAVGSQGAVVVVRYGYCEHRVCTIATSYFLKAGLYLNDEFSQQKS